MTYEQAFSMKNPFVLFTLKYSDILYIFKSEDNLFYSLVNKNGLNKPQRLPKHEWANANLIEAVETSDHIETEYLEKILISIFLEERNTKDNSK